MPQWRGVVEHTNTDGVLAQVTARRLTGELLVAAVERRGGVFSTSSLPFIHLESTVCILASDDGVREVTTILGVDALVAAREAMPS